MCKHVNKIDKLQISTHTIWWSKDPISAKKAMNKIEDFHMKKVHNEFSLMKRIQSDYRKKINL